MRLLFCLVFLAIVHHSSAQTYNLDVEKVNTQGKPADWNLGFNKDMQDSYPVTIDSTVKHGGKYALKLSNAKKGADFGSCSMIIPSNFKGNTIVFKGFLKTEDVKTSSGLWLRLDGETSMLGFENMENRPVTGTNDWKEFTITIPYREDVVRINAGALLVGEGTIWLDDLSLQIDNKNLADVPRRKVFPAGLDTSFAKSSGLNFEMNESRQEALTVLGQVWGFLKYYHPAIAQGMFNWDAELMRVLPSIVAATKKDTWMTILEKWIDKLPPVPACPGCHKTIAKDSLMLSPDYGSLFKKGYLSATLSNKLEFIQLNANNSIHYYVTFERGVGNPRFTNELAYNTITYPDAGIRLLALYRYWNQIQYFFPYRHLISEDWNKVLPTFVPEFINAKDSTEYMLACLKLIATVHDTHANIWGNNRTLNSYKGGYYAPFSTTFVEEKLVVKNFLTDTAGIKNLVTRGDVITHVDGQTVKEYIRQNLQYTPASNYSTQLRNIQSFILRGSTDKIALTIDKNGKAQTITIPRYPARYLNFAVDYDPSPRDSSYKIINGDIGYVYPAKYRNGQLPAIINTFRNTKGIVVDMRCYPSEFMPFTFGNYIKVNSSPFVTFTGGTVQRPGMFLFRSGASNGNKSNDSYNGKVIVIVNEETQSQAEYTTMSFQSSPNVKVIGSTTAGADGNVSEIILPGGITTMISGIGVYYPDKTETQRAGVKIDQVIKPTLKGYREGRDELLEKAIEMIRQ